MRIDSQKRTGKDRLGKELCFDVSMSKLEFVVGFMESTFASMDDNSHLEIDLGILLIEIDELDVTWIRH